MPETGALQTPTVAAELVQLRQEVDLLLDRAFGATCTICGIEAGYTGQGAKTAVPPWAVCKLDFRCPPYLDPLKQLEKLKAHLAAEGFSDVEVHVITARRNPLAHMRPEKIT